MGITRGQPTGVQAVLPLRRSTHGVSASFMIRADDGNDYWCKAVNNPVSTRMPCNEQLAARLGRLVGIAVPEPVLVDVSGIAGWEFAPGLVIEAGWAHGAQGVDAAIETRSLQHRNDDDNRVRHVGFYGLMDWLAGGDQQWLYSGTEQNAYYSHDHGHYFPGGPDWNVAQLAVTGTNHHNLGVDPAGLDPGEVSRLADAIEAVTKPDIEDVMSNIPPDWPVPDGDLEELATFLDARRSPAADRLRALVP